MISDLASFLGIALALGLLILMAYRGWSVLFLAPVCALIAAAFSGFPLLASWTQIFMTAAAGFMAQFFPLFLLGAVFAKLMNDSGSVRTIADAMIEKLGTNQAILAVVLAGAILTYGGVSLFVAFFVLVPMAQALFRTAEIPKRLIPATIILGTSSFTMTALPGTPAIQNVIPMTFFGTTLYAAPGLGIIAAFIMLGTGLGWLYYARQKAAARDEFYGEAPTPVIDARKMREHTTTASTFDPAELDEDHPDREAPSFLIAFMPIALMIICNLILSIVIFPDREAPFLSRPEWGGTTLKAVSGVWSVLASLALATILLLIINWKRLPSIRNSIDSGTNAAVLPVLSVSSLVGFGAVIASLPAFHSIKDWVLNMEGGPLVSLAVATNLLAALTGSASGGLTIALDALGPTYMAIAEQTGINPALMHRVASIGCGTLDILPHNGAIVTLLALSGVKHREGYFDIVMAGIVTSLIALVAVIALGSLFGSF